MRLRNPSGRRELGKEKRRLLINFRLASEDRNSCVGNRSENAIAGIAHDDFRACVGKARRKRTSQAGKTPNWKKAIVTLKEGDKITLT